MIFCIIENISTAVQDATAFTFKLLQIYTDWFNIDKRENKTDYSEKQK